MGKLTRDGTGQGWLEIDTAIASKVDAVYLVDVVVTALMLVAHADEQFKEVEVFEPPPVFGGPDGSLTPSKRGRRDSRGSRMSRKEEKERKKEEKERQRESKRGKSRMEQFEMDIESQTSDLKKGSGSDKEKVPGLARGIIALLTVTFKCIIWCLSLVFRALRGLVKCLSSDKL